MKKATTLITLLLTVLTTAVAQDYYDLTEHYLKNALFDSDYNYDAAQTGNVAQELLTVEGWTAEHSADYTIVGIYQIGTKKTYNGAAVPALNALGTDEGGVLALSTGWDQTLTLRQGVTLPAGSYKLVSAYYNGDASKTAGQSLLAWKPTSGTGVSSKVTSFAVGKWVVDTLSFTLTATKAGSIQIGFKGASGGSGNSAKIAVDYVKLLRDTPYGEPEKAIYKEQLGKAIKAANTQYGVGNKRGATVLKAAIDAAQAVYDSEGATLEALTEATDKVNAAVDENKALLTASSKLFNLLTKAKNSISQAGEGGEGVPALQAVVDAAQLVYDNADATSADLVKSCDELAAAAELFNYSYPTGAIPSVEGHKRFVRGATMAFGRMTYKSNGATLKERGFCWSESPEPTIHDNRSTKALSSSNVSKSGVVGTIYVIEGLTPCTRYYMRPYVITTGYQVSYGQTYSFYTIPMGTITYTLRDGDDGNGARDRIKAATEDALYYWNNLTEMKYFHPNIGYESGTPTADCSYGGWMRVGPNRGNQKTGTILHELLHGCGVIPGSTEWGRTGRLRAGVDGDGRGVGNWLGERAANVVKFFTNDESEVLHGDYQHLWPFGINGSDTDTGEPILYMANGAVCQALGEDGLQHTEELFAEPYYALEQEDGVKYYLKNESPDFGLYDAYFLPTQDGKLTWRAMSPDDAVENDSCAWYITFDATKQYYQFRNVATGQYLTCNAGIKMTDNLSDRTDWHVMPGRVDVFGQRGYWIIYNTGNWSPLCVEARANGAVRQGDFNIGDEAAAQRWLVMNENELRATGQHMLDVTKQLATTAIDDVRRLLEVPHKEAIAGTDQQLAATLDALQGRIDAFTSPEQIQAAIGEKDAVISEAREASLLFLENVVATDESNPFDLTYMLVNPTLAENSDGWSVSKGSSYGCVEFYQTTFDFNQTVSNMPKGDYRLLVQAFQRPGSYASCATVATNATVYAGSGKASMAHIKDGGQASKVGTGTEVQVEGKYVPDNMQAAGAYFDMGLYDNSVKTLLDERGSLKVGVRTSSMPSSYWAIFRNFRLYFLGQLTASGIETVNGETEVNNHYFDLQGRRVDVSSTLPKGVYIVRPASGRLQGKKGRKVVVR